MAVGTVLGWHSQLCPTLYRMRSCSPSRSVVPSGRISFTKAMEKIFSLLSLAGREEGTEEVEAEQGKGGRSRVGPPC